MRPMKALHFLFRMALGFLAVFGAGVLALGFAITGPPTRSELAHLRDGASKAYVAGLTGIEQAARRLRGDHCADPEAAGCG